jgi:hypothetical protein
MELASLVFSGLGSCMAQACCWYHIFRYCGCIQSEREIVVAQTPPPPPISQNPFLVQGSHYDKHLEPAYRG